MDVTYASSSFTAKVEELLFSTEIMLSRHFLSCRQYALAQAFQLIFLLLLCWVVMTPYTVISNQLAIEINKIWEISCTGDCFGLWAWWVALHIRCASQVGVCRAATAEGCGDTWLWNLPFDRWWFISLEVLREKSTETDRISTPATTACRAGAAKEEEQSSVRLQPSACLTNPKPVISLLITALKKQNFYCVV